MNLRMVISVVTMLTRSKYISFDNGGLRGDIIDNDGRHVSRSK